MADVNYACLSQVIDSRESVIVRVKEKPLKVLMNRHREGFPINSEKQERELLKAKKRQAVGKQNSAKEM